ncbi:MAG: restriction endonuclease subunit [Bryobacterales bacterium]|nr:restriction endonuclease subunit [Bryobacterales bacterium]
MIDEYVEFGIPLLRSQNIRPFRLDQSNMKYISEDFHKKLKKSALAPGDVVVVRTGYPGTACVIPKTLSVANCADLVIIRPSRDIDPHFLSSLFNSAWGKSTVAGNLVGAAQQHFNVGAAKSMSVRLPAIGIQRRIASILSAYDELIENNTRRIKILEDMAQMIYREWFVNFRFPGHENGPMVESELGPIPEGWSAKCVTDAVLVNPATRVPKEGMKPFLPMGGLSEDSMLISNVEEREGNSGVKFKNGDTLFARITPCLENGKTGFVQFLASDDAVAFGSTEFIVLRSKTVCPEYLYLMARSSEFRNNAIKSMSGATGRQRVQQACFNAFFIAQPDEDTLVRFRSVVGPMFKLVTSLNSRNVNLRSTRDFLLPKLVSGEVQVEAAAELLEQTA